MELRRFDTIPLPPELRNPSAVRAAAHRPAHRRPARARPRRASSPRVARVRRMPSRPPRAAPPYSRTRGLPLRVDQRRCHRRRPLTPPLGIRGKGAPDDDRHPASGHARRPKALRAHARTRLDEHRHPRSRDAAAPNGSASFALRVRRPALFALACVLLVGLGLTPQGARSPRHSRGHCVGRGPASTPGRAPAPEAPGSTSTAATVAAVQTVTTATGQPPRRAPPPPFRRSPPRRQPPRRAPATALQMVTTAPGNPCGEHGGGAKPQRSPPPAAPARAPGECRAPRQKRASPPPAASSSAAAASHPWLFRYGN